MEDRGDGLRVRLSQPQHGWIELKIETQGEEFKEAISYTPNDFLLELVSALSLALQGVEGVAVASCEPTTYEFTLSPSRQQGLLQFQITKYPNWSRAQRSGSVVLSSHAPALGIVTPFWRALRNLEGEVEAAEYREAMRRDFPSSNLEHLSDLIANQRRQ